MAIKDLVSGVLSESITTSTTNILVNVAQGISASEIQSFFPAPPFHITIMPKSPTIGVANRLDSEILQVTAVGSDQSGNASLTCVRGQRDTTAKAFSAGDIMTVGIYAEDAVLLGGEGSTTSTTTYEKKLVDKDGNTIVPITGYMGKIYTATLSSASGGVATYTFSPDTEVEANRVYAVKFPAPTVNNATIILGDGVVSDSILVPPVAATDSPNYELLTTNMINDTEPLLLMYNGTQWVCLNQKKKVATADLETFRSPVPTTTILQNYGTISSQTSKIMPSNGYLIGKAVVLTDGGHSLIALSDNDADFIIGGIPYAASTVNTQKGFCIPVKSGMTIYFRLSSGSIFENVKLVEMS